MDARLAKHFLKRLRHRAEADAIDYAVEKGILAVDIRTVDGKDVFHFAPGPAVAGKSEREILRLLQRSAGSRSQQRTADAEEFPFAVETEKTTAQDRRQGFASGSDDTSREAGRLPNAKWLLRAVRQSAEPLKAVEVAALLLVAKAVSESKVTLGKVLAALRTASPIVTITVPVAGFDDAFLDLLVKGLVLPGKVGICSGYDLVRNNGFRFSRANDPLWQVIVFEGGRADGAFEEKIERQLGIAAQSSYPIIGVADAKAALPEHLTQAAELNLACGPIDMEIIRETMRAVLGEVSEGGGIAYHHSSVLTFSDLALAIRPEMSVGRVVDLLENLARMRLKFAGQYREGSGSSDKGSDRRTSSSTTATRTTRGNPGSGSEIIQPAALTGTDLDRFVLRVETLTGYGEAKDWALALRDDLALWRDGNLAWEDMSVKLLLSGPPGTGKTSFAKALCNSLQVPMIASSVAAWLEPGYLGDVLKRMSATFSEAQAASPSILFIDEFDGIGRRGSGREWDTYWNSIINRLLELLDGAAKSSGVVVIGATNRPAMIDAALVRSGRLEKHIIIPRPNTDALIGILRHHLRGDLDAVVASAPPELGADPDPSNEIEAANGVSTALPDVSPSNVEGGSR
ncbi:ATP-binding protein [Mesorhizobium sp. MSK_1335]|uniref:ATP-binding protein n=1 Tax=Mesorhizobium montanum TaxID=3072323 RepID=A0ABU4ZNQ4_9HYPH|nr:ATP-binding protein [Mesorhizobium sp. MSK_1335]MDX8527014.1 ATP-binding protein [Mesorhizobium sp. MSK_1335]